MSVLASEKLAALLLAAAIGFGVVEPQWTLPYEERLAAQLGDTTGAVRVYDYYLSITASAEPSLAVKRDSIRAEIARLSRRAEQ